MLGKWFETENEQQKEAERPQEKKTTTTESNKTKPKSYVKSCGLCICERKDLPLLVQIQSTTTITTTSIVRNQSNVDKELGLRVDNKHI